MTTIRFDPSPWVRARLSPADAAALSMYRGGKAVLRMSCRTPAAPIIAVLQFRDPSIESVSAVAPTPRECIERILAALEARA